MINSMSDNPRGTDTPVQLDLAAQADVTTFTLERNSVLVARISRDSGYDLEELQAIKKHLQNVFPLHQILVWYDDIEFTVIHDKAYPSERMSQVNDSPNYY